MLRICLPRLALPAISKPLFKFDDAFTKDTPGSLFFSERAVKTTSRDPHFICTRKVLACQTPCSNAAIVLAAGDQVGICDTKPLWTSGLSQPQPLRACLRLHGNCAIGVFSRNGTVFQCLGDMAVQTHELTLRDVEVFAIICGVGVPEEALLAFTAIQRELQQRADMEYVAEELLLRLHNGTKEGSTAIVAMTSGHATDLPEPPLSSQALS